MKKVTPHVGILLKIFAIFFIILLCIVLLLFHVSSILGPWGYPDFVDIQQWEKLHVNYFLVTNHGILPKRAVFEGISLCDLQNAFELKEAHGMSVPTTGYLVLDTKDRTRWRIQLVTPDLLMACKDEDDYYAYALTLTNTAFYDVLRKKCLEKERIITPQANIENIQLCIGGFGCNLQEKCIPLYQDIP
jgi:hypothetical protein